MIKKLILILIIYLNINLYYSNAQKINELEKIKKEQYKKIEIKNKDLKSTKEKKSYVMDNLLVIRYNIEKRKKHIKNLNFEIENLNEKILDITNQMNELLSNIDLIKRELGNRIYKQYFYGKSYNEIIYIFSAKSFNQAYNRLIYFIKYAENKKNQIENILIKKEELEKKNKLLLENKNLKERLINEKEDEKKKLENDLVLEKNEFENLKKKEIELKEEIEELNNATIKIEKEIEILIENERIKKKSLNLGDEKLSVEFSKNKGILPWPVQNGIIISRFGEQPHPVFKGIKINNNGIDISTNADEEVKTIFNGEVSKVFSLKGSNYIVIIRHGSFISVYKNLNEVYVNIGDNLKTMQKIGNLYSDKNKNIAVLHFEIWNELKKLNPEEWIKK